VRLRGEKKCHVRLKKKIRPGKGPGGKSQETKTDDSNSSVEWNCPKEAKVPLGGYKNIQGTAGLRELTLEKDSPSGKKSVVRGIAFGVGKERRTSEEKKKTKAEKEHS